MADPKRSVSELRSQRWFAGKDMRGFAHRQRMQQQGLDRDEFMGRPVIAVVNTWSELSPCHAHLRERAEAIKRGVLQAGGYPLELPALSLGEVMVKPTTMMYRNLLAIEAEELLRSLPVDGAVLMGGCDKTTPGLVMGATSMDLPSIFFPAGPMLSDRYKGQTVGAGTHSRKYWDEYVAGRVGDREWIELEQRMTRTPGTCNVMGTASTMTSIVEAMGLALPGATSIPAMDAAHARMAWRCGKRIVEMVGEDLKPSRILSREAILNGVAAYLALGGSTNATIHLLAMAGRAGVALTLDDLEALAKEVPVLVDLYPSGKRLMEEFYYAGGLPALLDRMRPHLHLEAMTCTGASLGDNLARRRAEQDAIGSGFDPNAVGGPAGADAASRVDLDDVIRDLDAPLLGRGDEGRALAVLRGNLCPRGAVMKPSAASPRFFKHKGRALVFDSAADMAARVHAPDLDVDENTVLVLRGGGPIGAPGMPEWGNLPIPRKLLQRGVDDMVRLSDARMSGTHFGTCVLHIAPEAAVGGPLALLRTGDEVELDVGARSLNMLVDEAELARRRAAWRAPADVYQRGYAQLYKRHVGQADEGCDFDFLAGNAPTPEPVIY